MFQQNYTHNQRSTTSQVLFWQSTKKTCEDVTINTGKPVEVTKDFLAILKLLL